MTGPRCLYNPHCSTELSSWYRFGQQVLDYFYHSDKYNLIFSPHIMLFEKKLQVTLQSWRFRRPGTVDQKYRECEHMRIDTGSRMSTDMSYTLAADLYLGDVSSQVYEFLMEPRPCVFANPGIKAWENDPNYLHWQFGPVFDHIDQLETALESGFDTHADYLQVQQRNFAYSFDQKKDSSTTRSVRAIAKFVERDLTRPVTTFGWVQPVAGNIPQRSF